MSFKNALLAINLFEVVITVYSAAIDIPQPELNSNGPIGDLVFVHAFYRHGDRNPVLQGPGDHYDISYWPEGWGQLTNLGKQQQYELGQWFRRRYSHFLSSTFNVNDIYVRSSDVDRTLMSAQANLAGLYPPKDRAIWNKDLHWQPIPIHSMPENIDYLIGGSVPPCVAYEKALNDYARSAEMLQFYASVQPFYEYVSDHAGTTVNDPTALLLLRDSWYCQSIHNLTLPEWTKPLFPNNPEFDDAAMKFYSMSAATKFLSKFRTGFLLKDILDRFTSKTEKTLSPDAKIWMYSTHDSVLFSFLSSLDISDGDFVPYAAAIILELRMYQNNYYVQIFYKNSSETPKPIRIPGCGNVCPLSKMYQVYDDILPKSDFKTECQNIDV